MTLLTVEGLDHREGSAKLLHGISFTLDAGEVLGIVGPNGSGKSTLLQTIAGIRGNHAPVRLGDRRLADLTSRERAARIAYVGDDCTSEFSLTAEETVRIGTYA